MHLDPREAIPWDPTAIDWKEVEAYKRIPGVEKMDQALRLQQMSPPSRHLLRRAMRGLDSPDLSRYAPTAGIQRADRIERASHRRSSHAVRTSTAAVSV